jgi:hypothetical protein
MWTAFARGVAVLAATVSLVMGSATSAGAEPGPGPTGPPMDCPHGLPYKMTLEYALVRYAGYYTGEQIRAGFDGHDANDNGYACYHKDPPAAEAIFYPLVVFFPLDDFEGADPG